MGLGAIFTPIENRRYSLNDTIVATVTDTVFYYSMLHHCSPPRGNATRAVASAVMVIQRI